MPRGSWPAAVAGIAACAALPLLAGCGTLKQIGAGTHSAPASSYTISAHVTTVVINGGSGSIDVAGSARGTVLVTQQVSYSKTPPATTRNVSGSTLTLGYLCPSQLVCSVSYTLQVPRGVTVRAGTQAGSVTLTSLAGPVTARTDAGLITADALTSPTADLKSNAGGIVATFSAPPGSVTAQATAGLISATRLTAPTAELKSNAGGIDASFTAAPGAVHASTNIGAITINVPNSASYKISTHTYVGSSTINVRKDAASPHVITANSDLGSITISPS